MGLGLKAKNRRGPTVQVDYLIHVQEIKPWPPTQSLKNVRSVLIQWENGDRNSGNTSSVAPSVKDGKIEFNESFKLPVTFSRDMTAKSGDSDVFQKNLLEFNLYEPRRDKTVKGQLLGTAIVDLSDFAVVKEITSVNASLNCTRSFRNATQPVLYIKIEPVDKSRSGSSSKASLGKEASLERNGSGSISALMKEEYADEAEIASFTDDDVSSHSSVTASSALESNGASPARNKENGSVIRPAAQPNENRKSTSSRSTSVDLSSETGSPNNAPSSLRNISVETSESNPTNIVTHGAKSSTSYVTREISPGFHQEGGNLTGGRNSQLKSGEDMSNSISNKAALVPVDEKLDSANGALARASGGNEGKHELPRSDSMLFVDANDSYDDSISDTEKHEENGEPRHSIGSEMSDGFSPDLIRRQVSGCDAAFSKDRPRHVKSVRSSMDSAASNGSVVGLRSAVSKEAKVYTTERRNAASDGKVPELEQRIKMLEGELKEAAAIEASLYSVVAEHGSSINKVHTPARRLSRLYLQGGKGIRKASAARSAVSGLVVVAKSCGNDVPRLMFWLSNCVMVRAIIIQAFSENQLPVSAGPSLDGKGINKKSPTLKWKTLASDRKGNRRAGHESLVDWEDPHALTSALEKVESWIFSRIIESIWWQTLIPHMQSSAAKAFDKILDSGSKKYYRRNSSSGDQEQVNLSLELWKKAFKDARERLCPVRAGGHECGCLPVLSKLIMEQCVARLDVAMFNALLRESADHIPTDPVSDPISDARVLPIFAGKSSFGAGAQLKNAIGNWSRWLTDLFGMDDDDDDDGDPLEGDDDEQMYEVGDGDERRKHDKSFRSFHLLKSLSDLMMLPKDMLLSDSIRKEVCPTFGLQLIRRVLNNFVPDEFCPDPIPVAVFEALDTEESLEDEDSSMTNFPCTAPAVIYSPPSASSLTNIILGDIGSRSELRRSGSSVLRKSNTSDDELDELDSPLNSIAGESLMTSPAARMKGKQNGNENAVRYKLLREVWISSE